MGWVKANHNCPLDGATGWSPMAHVNGNAGTTPDWSSPDAAPAAAVDPQAGKSTHGTVMMACGTVTRATGTTASGQIRRRRQTRGRSKEAS